MVPEMTHWERIRAALKGDDVDRVPVSLWRHWPVDDETPDGLAAVTLHWQQQYDFDLVKFMPTGTYSIEDWGAETMYIPNHAGTRTITHHGITKVDQWPTLQQLEVTKGYLGKQITAVTLTADELKGSVPILQTVFSPLTTARKLAGDRVFSDLRLHPETFKEGLQVIAETTARFALESIRAGAHGIFFASQCGTYRLLNQVEYREFGEVYDLIVLNAVKDEAELNLVHIHGEDIMFDLMANYPAEALNWHDRLTQPTLAEALERFDGMAVGGISERKTLIEGPISAIEAEVKDAIVQTRGRRLMIGPGCVAPTNTPVEHIRAARAAVEAE